MGWDRRTKPQARKGAKLTPAQRNKIIRRDRANGVGCYFMFLDICTGLEGPIEVHHIIEAEDGGDNSDDNLRAACRNCHRRYSARQSQKRAVKAANEWKRQPERHPAALD